jgi:hypothetical protein
MKLNRRNIGKLIKYASGFREEIENGSPKLNTGILGVTINVIINELEAFKKHLP